MIMHSRLKGRQRTALRAGTVALLLAAMAYLGSCVPFFSAPSPPTNLTATEDESLDQIRIEWREALTGRPPTHFELWRSSKRSEGFQCIQDRILKTEWVDDIRGSYFYKVRACNGMGCSTFSNTAEGSTRQPTLLLDDGFNDPESGWTTDSYDERDYAYVNGMYSVRVLEPYYTAWAWSPRGELQGNIIVETTCYLYSRTGYGGIFWGNNTDFFLFWISAGGYYGFKRSARCSEDQACNWSNVIPATSSSRIDCSGGVNILTARVASDSITLYLNSVELDHRAGSGYGASKYGVGAASGSSHSAEVRFGYFRIWYEI